MWHSVENYRKINIPYEKCLTGVYYYKRFVIYWLIVKIRFCLVQ